MSHAPSNVDANPLALSAREAAKTLSISERLLWTKTQAGEIPCVKIGRRVVYPRHLLRAWLEKMTEGAGNT